MKILKLVKENVRDEYWHLAHIEIEGNGIAKFQFPTSYLYEGTFKTESDFHAWLTRQATSILNSEKRAKAA